jgi:hypothetical protein
VPDPIAHLKRECDGAAVAIRLVSASGGQALQTVLDRLWGEYEAHLPGTDPPPCLAVATEPEALAAVESLRQALPASDPSPLTPVERAERARLEAIIDQGLGAPAAGDGIIISPPGPDAIEGFAAAIAQGTGLPPASAAARARDPRFGPVLTAAFASSLLGGAATFSGGWFAGGEAALESAARRRPKMRSQLVGQIKWLWVQIGVGRYLLGQWGDAIAGARHFRLFEARGHSFASASQAALWLAESELAVAWRVMRDTGPPFSAKEGLFEEGCPLPPFNVDRWYGALGALCRHFSARGDVWGLNGTTSPWDAGLTQEVAVLKFVVSRGETAEPPRVQSEPSPAARALDIKGISDGIKASMPPLPEVLMEAYVGGRMLAELAGAIEWSLKRADGSVVPDDAYAALVWLRELAEACGPLITTLERILTPTRGGPVWLNGLAANNAHAAALALASLLLAEVDCRFEQCGAGRGEDGRPVWDQQMFRDHFTAIRRSFQNVRLPDWYSITAEMQFEAVKATAHPYPPIDSAISGEDEEHATPREEGRWQKAGVSDVAAPVPPTPPPGSGSTDSLEGAEWYVDLDGAAAMVNRTKSALEHYKRRKNDPLPTPDVPGGGGRKDEWKWSTIRPWLERTFGRALSSVNPANLPRAGI